MAPANNAMKTVNGKKFPESGRLLLRKLLPGDAEDIYLYVNDAQVVRWTSTIPYPYEHIFAAEFIKKTRREWRQRTALTYGIILKETGQLIGTIGLHDIKWKNRNAEIGYWLGKSYWGKGIMTEAVSLITRFAFEGLKLHRLTGYTFQENMASRQVLRKSGFRPEGIMKDFYLKHGKWHDAHIYGVLASEWEIRKQA